MYNFVLVSGVHQSDSVIHAYILFQSHFHYRLLQGIEYGSLCYAVGPYWLSILYTVLSVNLKLLMCPFPTHFPFGNHKLVVHICESVCVL